MFEKKYEDAIAVLSEIILNQRQIKQQQEWEIDRLKREIIDLEAKLPQGQKEE